MPSPLDQPEQPTWAEQSATGAAEASTTNDQPPQPLAIDFGETSNDPANPQDGPVQAMDLGEDNVIKLDGLGPMIINSDGTLSRIQNWYELTDIERERTVRLLVKKRNLVRMEKLRSSADDQNSSDTVHAP